MIDSFAVCGVCLAEIVAPIVAQERLRVEAGNSDRAGVMTQLAAEAGLSQRRIWGILNREFATVGFNTADALVMALDRPDLLQAIDVFPRSVGRFVTTAGNHACPGKFASAGLGTGSIEPLSTALPLAEAIPLVSPSDREAEAPAVRRRAA